MRPTPRRSTISLLSFPFVAAFALAASAAPSFEALPGFNPANPLDRRSEFQDVSGDGNVLVGWADLCSDPADAASCVRTAVRWDEGVLTSLGGVAGFGRSRANAVNHDGSVIVGWSQDLAATGRPISPIVWRGGVMEVPVGPDSILSRVSAEGGVWAGSERAAGSPWRVVRTDGNGRRPLDFDTLYDMTPDATALVGADATDSALLWQDGVYTLLPAFDPATGVHPRVISSDASTIVGWAPPAAGPQFPSQRVRGADVLILEPVTGRDLATVFGVSGNGDVIVGNSGTDTCGAVPCPPEIATVWDADGAARPIADVLASAGVDLGSWSLIEARWVSDDGFDVVGWAEDVNTGEMSPFRARIGDPVVEVPEPDPDPTLEAKIDIRPRSRSNWIDTSGRWQRYVEVAVMGSDALDVLDIEVDSLAFGPGGALPVPQRERRRDPTSRVWDINGDSYSDLIVRYRTREAGFGEGDTEGCVEGMTADGTKLHGCDEVNTESARDRWRRFFGWHRDRHDHDRGDDDRHRGRWHGRRR